MENLVELPKIILKDNILFIGEYATTYGVRNRKYWIFLSQKQDALR